MVVAWYEGGSAGLTLTAENVTSQNTAATAIAALDGAIAQVSSNRSALGAVSNRLEHTINNVAISRENLADIEKDIYIEEAYRVVVELANHIKK